jgi:hypothetical protein
MEEVSNSRWIIYLQRTTGPDDVININRCDNRLCEVIYKENDIPRIRQSFTTNNAGVVTYLLNLFELIKMDDEPYHSIEIILPNYPSVLLNIDKLTESKIDTCIKLFKYAVTTLF